MHTPHRILLLAALPLLFGTGASIAAGIQPFPDFWPKGQTQHHPSYDFWRVWLVRCEIRKVPTSPYNLADRHQALTNWLAELTRLKMPVDDVAPRQRVAKLAQAVALKDTAVACQEVDAIYRGLEGMVTGKEHVKGPGKICGTVLDDTGAPVEGADITLFGTPLGAIANADGDFTIDNVPCTSPRYIVRARKQGLLDAYVGRINPLPGHPGEAVLLMERQTPENAWRTGELAVRVARLVDLKQTAEPAALIDAAVADPDKYPDQVKPYLNSSPTIDSDSAAVKTQAQQILASLSEADRAKSSAIARAVYAWVVRNIDYDLMTSFPDDSTCGNWQATLGAWSRSLDDWCYKPSEVLEQKRATDIEFERLAAALLRALKVPARPAALGAHPVCQWWIQLPAGNGYWANMETSLGRNEFRRSGSTNARIPAVGDHAIAFYSVDERAPVHMSWDALSPTLWIEDYGEQTSAGHNPTGLKVAQQWLGIFADKGSVPRATPASSLPTPARGVSCYELAARGVVIKLSALRGQHKLTVRFPVFLSNQYRSTLDIKQWTNHPEWVKGTRREKEQNKFTGESLEWFCVDFEPKAPAPPPAAAGGTPAPAH